MIFAVPAEVASCRNLRKMCSIVCSCGHIQKTKQIWLKLLYTKRVQTKKPFSSLYHSYKGPEFAWPVHKCAVFPQ